MKKGESNPVAARSLELRSLSMCILEHWASYPMHDVVKLAGDQLNPVRTVCFNFTSGTSLKVRSPRPK